MKITNSKTIIQKVIQPSIPIKPVKDINELLSRPIEELAALPHEELKKLLEPYIPATRLSLLPAEKPRKMGVETRAVIDAIEKNRHLIEQFKAARLK